MEESRVEDILQTGIDGGEYKNSPQSRVEDLLIQLINEGGTGASTYRPGGSVTFNNLPALSKSTLGYVYDITDSFITTSDFKEGAGKRYPAGTNVAIVDAGTDENPVYKYDCLSGFVDLSGYVEKEEGKGLSSNDYTDAEKTKLSELSNYDDTAIITRVTDIESIIPESASTENELVTSSDLSGYVEKEEGKGLSTEDYTTAEKTKLSNLSNYDDTEIRSDISDIEEVIPASASLTNKLSTAADVANEEISSTASGTSITVNDTTDGYLQGVNVKGRSEVTSNLFGGIVLANAIYNVCTAGSINTTNKTISYTHRDDPNNIIVYDNFKENTVYTIILTGKQYVEDGVNDSLRITYKNGNYTQMSFPSTTKRTVVYTTDGNSIKDIELGWNRDGLAYLYYDESGIFEGNITVYDFEKYGIKSIGDDGLTVQTTGKNLVNPSTIRNGYYEQEGYIDNSDFRTSDLIPVKSNTEYVASMFSKNGDFISNLVYNEYDVNGELISAVITSSYITTSSNTAFIRVRNYYQDHGYITNNNFVYQLELGSTATAYEPYRSTSAELTTALPLRSVSDEIYDTLDNTKVTKMCKSVKGNDLTWSRYQYGQVWLFYADINDTLSEKVPCLCDKYTYKDVTYVNQLEDKEYILYSNNTLYIRDDSYTDTQSFITAVANMEIVYPLATPTETPLTSTEKSALASLRTYDSVTHIEATDEPEMTVGYLKNTKNGEAVAKIDAQIKSTYTKEEVVSLFVKSNDLTAYVLTFSSQNGHTITLTETDQANNLSVTFRMPDSGSYTDLFFFHKSATLAISIDGTATAYEHILASYVDTVDFTTPVALIPAMTASTAPSGTASASTEQGAHPAYASFSQVTNAFWANSGGDGNNGAYLEYDWASGTSVIPKKFEFYPLTGSTMAVLVVKIQLWDSVQSDWVDASEAVTAYTNSATKYNSENSCHVVIPIINTFETAKIRLAYVSTSYGNNANAGAAQAYGTVISS